MDSPGQGPGPPPVPSAHSRDAYTDVAKLQSIRPLTDCSGRAGGLE